MTTTRLGPALLKPPDAARRLNVTTEALLRPLRLSDQQPAKPDDLISIFLDRCAPSVMR